MNQRSIFKLILGIGLALFLFSGTFYFYQKYKLEKREADLKYEVEKRKAEKRQEEDEKRVERERELERERQRKEAEAERNRDKLCNEAKALECFNTYMSNNYPDWPIYSASIYKRLDCIYNVTFKTNNPHFTNFGGKEETHVVEISFDLENDKFFFKSVRDVLY